MKYLFPKYINLICFQGIMQDAWNAIYREISFSYGSMKQPMRLIWCVWDHILNYSEKEIKDRRLRI